MLEILEHLPCMKKDSIYGVTASTLDKVTFNAKRGPFDHNCTIIYLSQSKFIFVKSEDATFDVCYNANWHLNPYQA